MKEPFSFFVIMRKFFVDIGIDRIIPAEAVFGFRVEPFGMFSEPLPLKGKLFRLNAY